MRVLDESLFELKVNVISMVGHLQSPTAQVKADVGHVTHLTIDWGRNVHSNKAENHAR